MRIDDRASIPVVWFVVSIVSVIGGVYAGSFWMFSVNERLGRIEEKLGIRNITRATREYDLQEAYALQKRGDR